jgi:hypothetical protein
LHQLGLASLLQPHLEKKKLVLTKIADYLEISELSEHLSFEPQQ